MSPELPPLRATAEIGRLTRCTWVARVSLGPAEPAFRVHAFTRARVERKARRLAKRLMLQAEWRRNPERLEVTP